VFVNVVEFPPVVDGRDAQFREWFEWSNGVYAAFAGFVSRRLLEDIAAPGRYAARLHRRLDRRPLRPAA
jgi:hypothetical protein